MRAEKQIILDELLARINASPFVIVTNYTGMTVTQFTTLRKRLRDVGAECHVSKNTHVKRVIKDAELPDELGGSLQGQTAIVTGQQDVCAAAKVLKTFASESNKLELKAGALDGAYLDAAGISALAELPSREVLLAQLLGLLQTPATQLARVLNEPAASLARVLQAKADKEG